MTADTLGPAALSLAVLIAFVLGFHWASLIGRR